MNWRVFEFVFYHINGLILLAKMKSHSGHQFQLFLIVFPHVKFRSYLIRKKDYHPPSNKQHRIPMVRLFSRKPKIRTPTSKPSRQSVQKSGKNITVLTTQCLMNILICRRAEIGPENQKINSFGNWCRTAASLENLTAFASCAATKDFQIGPRDSKR